MDKWDAIFIIGSLILVAIFCVYIFIAYRRRWVPFRVYNRVTPPDTFLVNANTRQFSPQEIELRKQNAATLCEAAANTTNFMNDYCNQPILEAGSIDCSSITN